MADIRSGLILCIILIILMATTIGISMEGQPLPGIRRYREYLDSDANPDPEETDCTTASRPQ